MPKQSFEPKKSFDIGIIPIGDIPQLILDVIAAHIVEYMNLEVRFMPDMAVPIQAWQQSRQQYDAGRVLRCIDGRTRGDVEKLLGVLAVDLFIPIFTHVFGSARQGADCGIVSIYRLADHPQERAAPTPRLLERSAKVAMHEIGHLYNLVHCEDNHCLMHFSGNVEELDQLPVFFCRYCLSFLKQHRK